MQIKHYSEVPPHVRMAIIKRSTSNKYQGGCGEKGNFKQLLEEMEVGAATTENNMEVPQKTKIRVAVWSNNPTPERISGQNHNSRRHMHSKVHSSTTYNSTRHGSNLNVHQQMSKDDVVIYKWKTSTLPRKEWNNAICSNMGETRDYHTKWSKSERKRQRSSGISYMWNLKYDTLTYLWNINRLTDIENRLLAAKGGMEEGQWTGSLGLSDTNYLPVEWINKILLYSTGNFI